MKYSFYLLILINSNFLFANYSELYSSSQYINNRQVLLYKIINWWNVESNKNNLDLCAKSVKYIRTNNINIEYNESSNKLTLLFVNSFANLVDIFKECKNCFGPSYLENVFLNKKYFNSKRIENISKELFEVKRIVLNNVNKKQAMKVLNLQKNISLELEGFVGGLLLANNKLSLHQSGEFFRLCSKKKKENYPVFFRVISTSSKELLLEYKVIWDEK